MVISTPRKLRVTRQAGGRPHHAAHGILVEIVEQPLCHHERRGGSVQPEIPAGTKPPSTSEGESFDTGGSAVRRRHGSQSGGRHCRA